MSRRRRRHRAGTVGFTRNPFGDDAAVDNFPGAASTVQVPPPPSAAPALTEAAAKATDLGAHPAIAVALTNAAAVASGKPPPAPAPAGPEDASVLAQAAVASNGTDHPAVTKVLANAALVAKGGAGTGTPGTMPVPAPTSAAVTPLLAAAATANQDGSHPAIVAALANGAAVAAGTTPPAPPPQGPVAAKVLTDAASASVGNDHPAVTAVLTNAAAVAAGAPPAPAILANAAASASAAGAHPAVTVALANAAATSAGAPPPSAPPVGADAASALASAAKASDGVSHPIVTATLAKAAAVAAPPAPAESPGAVKSVVTQALASAAKSADAAANPGVAAILAKAATANLEPTKAVPGPLGAGPSTGVNAGADAAISAAYDGGAPASPAVQRDGSPPRPPALAALPPAQVETIEAKTLSTLKAKNGSGPTTLLPGESLARGEYMASHARGHGRNPRWKLVHQNDGDVVLYHGTAPIWAAGTAGLGSQRLTMHPSGELMLTDAGGRRLWGTGVRAPGAMFALQDDGNAVVYQGDRPLWGSAQDDRAKGGRNRYRVGNVFVGSIERHGAHGHHFDFGAEQSAKLYHRLRGTMGNVIPGRYRRGWDLAMIGATGRLSPDEMRAAASDFSPDDRAGLAAGVALGRGVRHPHFAHHLGTSFGWEWRPWRWFGWGGGAPGADGDGGELQPPDGTDSADVSLSLQPASSGLSDDAPAGNGNVDGSASGPDDGSDVPAATAAVNASTSATMAAGVAPPPAQTVGGAPVLTAPFVFPDGSRPELPHFRSWEERQRWELERHREWERAHHGPPQGGWRPGIGWIAPPGSPQAVPLAPPSDGRIHGSRRAWHEDARARHEAIHDANAAAVASANAQNATISLMNAANAATAGLIGITPNAPMALVAPFLLPDGTSYPLPRGGFRNIGERRSWEDARRGDFHAHRIHGEPVRNIVHPDPRTDHPRPEDFHTPRTSPSGQPVIPHHWVDPQTGQTTHVVNLVTGAGHSVHNPQTPPAASGSVAIPVKVVQTGTTQHVVDPSTGATTHVIDPSTGVAHPVINPATMPGPSTAPSSNPMGRQTHGGAGGGPGGAQVPPGAAPTHANPGPTAGPSGAPTGTPHGSGGGSGSGGAGSGHGHGGKGAPTPNAAGDFGWERRWMPGGGMSDRALGMAGIPTPGQFMGQVIQYDQTMAYDAGQADADAAAGITPPPMVGPDGTPIVAAPVLPYQAWDAGRGWGEGRPPPPPGMWDRRGPRFHGESDFGWGRYRQGGYRPGGGMSDRALRYAGVGQPGQFMADVAQYDQTMQADAAQAAADVASGITPPPMVGPDGMALVAPPVFRPRHHHRDPRRFHGDFGAEARTSPKASDLQLAGAAIGVGAAGLPKADRDAAEKVAASHVHSLAGMVLAGAGNILHKAEAWWNTLIHPSKKVKLPDGSTVTTLAPVEIKGEPSTAPAPGSDGFGWDIGERFHRKARLGPGDPSRRDLPPHHDPRIDVRHHDPRIDHPDSRRHDPRFRGGRPGFPGYVAPNSPAAPMSGGANLGASMGSGQIATPGQFFTSPNGTVRVGVDAGGNLVLPGVAGMSGVATLTMQPDGNLVATGTGGNVVWASGTNTRAFSSYMAGQTLHVGDDGNVAILSPDGTRIMWATNTYAGGSGVPGPGQGV